MEQIDQRLEKGAEEGRPVHTGELEDGNVGSQAEMLEQGPSDNEESKRSSDKSTGSECSSGKGKQSRPSVRSLAGVKEDDPNYEDALSFWEPKPPKVFMKDPEEQPLELRSQIQIYALNEYVSRHFICLTTLLISGFQTIDASPCISRPSRFSRKSLPSIHHSRRWRGPA